VPVDVRPARPEPFAQWMLARRAGPVPAGPVLAGLLLAVALLAAGLAGCGSQPAAGNVITISTGACGTGWGRVHAGMQSFQVRNSDTAGAEAYLINPASGAVFAEVSGLGPGTTRPMRLDVGSGRYAFQCFIQDTDTLTGPTVRVGGHHQGARGILPVTTNDLLGPARVYHAYASAGLDTLARQVGRLSRLIRAGRLNAARAAWLPAHLTYERLGAAYGTFDNFDGEIDGRADGLARGVSDPAFTGFYRIEYGLWHGQPARQLAGPAAKLRRNVLALRRAWPSMEVDLLDLGLRTHEILENALQFQLTGHDDYGSGTTLATTAANVTGTRELLTILRPLLVPRYPGLPAVDAGLDKLDSLLLAEERPGGHWTPVRALGTDRREQIDAAAGQVLQELDPIAAITEPRR
jgi:iron uptake system component EfeO